MRKALAIIALGLATIAGALVGGPVSGEQAGHSWGLTQDIELAGPPAIDQVLRGHSWG